MVELGWMDRHRDRLVEAAEPRGPGVEPSLKLSPYSMYWATHLLVDP
jgi:hypothetical protein